MITDNSKQNETMYDRTEMMLGTDAVCRLKNAKIILFGVGGVGGYALEALVRAGVGFITLVDSDRVSVSNLNRQIIATLETVGMYKVDAAALRAKSINPNINIQTRAEFFSEENISSFDLSGYDYVIDAIDTVKEKIALISLAKRCGTRIISSMGAGNKLDPTRFRVSDIYKTTTDPLARALRGELKRRGIKSLKVVFSDEEPLNPTGARTPGSISFVPSSVGLIIAGEVIKDIALEK